MRSHAKRVLKAIGAAAGLGGTFVVALAGGALLHVDLPAARRIAAVEVDRILHGSFKGQIVLDRIGHLDLGGIDGVRAHVIDPEGRTALTVDGVRARIATIELLRTLFGAGEMRVHLRTLEIGSAEVLLAPDGGSAPSVAEAIEPAPKPEPATPEPPGRGVSIVFDRIRLGHAWIHGDFPGAPMPIDADVDGLDAKLAHDANGTRVTVHDVRVVARNVRGSTARVAAHGSVDLPAEDTMGLAGDLAVDASLGDVIAKVRADVRDRRVSAHVEVPQTSPEALRAAIAESPLRAPLAVDVKIDGPFDALVPDVHVAIGGGSIDASGRVDVIHGLHGALHVTARALDAQVAAETAPPTRIGFDLAVTADGTSAADVAGHFDLQTLPGEVGTTALPAATVSGAWSPKAVSGTARIAERGAPVKVDFDARLAPDVVVRFDGNAAIAEMSQVPRLAEVGRGAVVADFHGVVDVGKKSLDATAKVGAANVSTVQGGVARAQIDAHVRGTFGDPSIDASIDADGVTAGRAAVDTLTARASGHLSDLQVSLDARGKKIPHVTVNALLLGPAHVKGAEITAERDIDRAVLRIADVRHDGDTIAVSGLHAEGFGDVDGDARIAPEHVIARLHAPKIDVPRLAKILGVADEVDRVFGTAGSAGIDVDVDLDRRGGKGTFGAHFERAGNGVPGRGTARAQVDGTIDGRHVAVKVRGAYEKVLTVDGFDADGDLGGGPLDRRAWKTAEGRLRFDVTSDLAEMIRVAPNEIPLEAARGSVHLHGEIARGAHAAVPDVTLHADATRLALTGKPPVEGAQGTGTKGPMGWRIGEIDASVDLAIAGGRRIDASASVKDVDGPLAGFAAHAELPLAEIVADPSRATALAMAAPIGVNVVIPDRPFAKMPTWIGRPLVGGSLAGRVTLEGTALAPNVHADVFARGVRPMSAKKASPLDAHFVATYDTKTIAVNGQAAVGGQTVGTAEASVDLPAAEIPRGAPSWEAGAKMHLERFPLLALGPIIHRKIGGYASGDVTIEHVHKAPRADVAVDFDALTLGKAAFKSGRVTVGADASRIKARARFEQLPSGVLDATFATGITWADATVPGYDPKAPLEATLLADNFRAAALAPFLGDAVGELDGRIDADAVIHGAPGGKDGAMSGSVVIDRASFEIPAIGERFHDVHASVLIKPWGTVRVDGIHASSTSGQMTASASAALKGLSLQNAQLQVHIGDNDKMPITVQGVSYGDVACDLKIAATLKDEGKDVDVRLDAPMLHLTLPQSSTHAVQGTDADPTIEVGVYRRDGSFGLVPLGPPKDDAPRAKDATRLHVAVNLGNDVWIKRDTMLRVQLTGSPKIEVTDRTRIEGEINVPYGIVEVLGKRFQIERATVSFANGDPANPVVNATAFYDAPDGSRVFADFVGPVKKGKLTLRSDPPHTENEIVAILLFGSADGSAGSSPSSGPSPDPTTKAAGMGMGLATDAVNRALSGVQSVEITTRVATNNSGNPRPEVAFQLSPSLTAQIAYNLGVPSPLDNPDRTMLLFDWRFKRSWTLSTTFGDEGTSILDLAWQYRY